MSHTSHIRQFQVRETILAIQIVFIENRLGIKFIEDLLRDVASFDDELISYRARSM
jgi:hypothetical protein